MATNKNKHLFPLRKTKVLRYGTRSPSKYLTSLMGFCLKLFPMIHFHNVTVSTLFSLLPSNGNQCSDHWNPSWICMSISNSKSKFKSKIKIKFQYIQTIFKYKPPLDKSSMKSKIEFKYDIRK